MGTGKPLGTVPLWGASHSPTAVTSDSADESKGRFLEPGRVSSNEEKPVVRRAVTCTGTPSHPAVTCREGAGNEAPVPHCPCSLLPSHLHGAPRPSPLQPQGPGARGQEPSKQPSRAELGVERGLWSRRQRKLPSRQVALRAPREVAPIIRPTHRRGH